MGEFVPVTSEPLAIDLINTRALLPNIGWVDALESLTGLRFWLTLEQDRITPDGGRLTQADLTAVHTLRDHIASAVDRARYGQRPTQPSLRGINTAIHTAPAVPRLAWKNDHLVQERIRPHRAGAKVVAQLAEAAANLLTDPKVTAVRECALDDCVMLFYPTNPRRKWCVDAICGNRARVARHYHKYKPQSPAVPSLD